MISAEANVDDMVEDDCQPNEGRFYLKNLVQHNAVCSNVLSKQGGIHVKEFVTGTRDDVALEHTVVCLMFGATALGRCSFGYVVIWMVAITHSI